MKAKRLNANQINTIIQMYDSYSCVEIANKLNISINQVYGLRQKLNLTQKQNPQFELNDLQKQILYSGKLGDGNFKVNGNTGCYYRESHAENELEYLTWKANVFGRDIVSAKWVHPIKLRNNSRAFKNKQIYTIQQPYLFATKTSSVFNYFKDLSTCDTIKNLTYEGLIMFLLDDGWLNYDKRIKNKYGKGHFCISRGTLTQEDLEILCKKYNEYGMNAHIISRGDISFYQHDNELIYQYATSFIPKDIDIMQKKFQNMQIVNI